MIVTWASAAFAAFTSTGVVYGVRAYCLASRQILSVCEAGAP